MGAYRRTGDFHLGFANLVRKRDPKDKFDSTDPVSNFKIESDFAVELFPESYCGRRIIDH